MQLCKGKAVFGVGLCTFGLTVTRHDLRVRHECTDQLSKVQPRLPLPGRTTHVHVRPSSHPTDVHTITIWSLDDDIIIK